MPRSGTKEHPTAKNSDVLNRNFDLPLIDHIRQLENPHYVEVVHLHVCSFCSSCYITVIQIGA